MAGKGTIFTLSRGGRHDKYYDNQIKLIVDDKDAVRHLLATLFDTSYRHPSISPLNSTFLTCLPSMPIALGQRMVQIDCIISNIFHALNN